MRLGQLQIKPTARKQMQLNNNYKVDLRIIGNFNKSAQFHQQHYYRRMTIISHPINLYRLTLSPFLS